MDEWQKDFEFEVLTAVVQRAMWCSHCSKVLGVHTAAFVFSEKQGTVVCTGCLDQQVELAGPPPDGIEIIDGRSYVD